MLSRIAILWIVYAGVMGFAVGGSFVSAYLSPQATVDQGCAEGDQPSRNCDTPEKRHEAAEATLSYYTKWLMFFTAGMAAATVALGIATIGLYLAAEKAIGETQRIGEAQVRAYVHIKFIVLDFLLEAICPRVSFMAANTGQSPARNFIWNMTLQYIDQTKINREVTFNPKWQEYPGIDIAAASEAPPDAALIPDMSIKLYVAPKTSHCVVRLKIDYRFTDVFGKCWFGESYFSGIIAKNPLSAEGFQVGPDGKITVQAWSGKLSPEARPRDWDGVRKAQET